MFDHPESPSSSSRNAVERCVDGLSQITLFSREPAATNVDSFFYEDNWDMEQCLVCTRREDQLASSDTVKFYRGKFVGFLSLSLVFILAKLAQAAGNAGTSSVLSYGGSFNLPPSGALLLSWSGFVGSVITTAFTRLIAIVETCSRVFFKDGANQAKRARLTQIANQNYAMLTPVRRLIYNLTRYLLLFCALVTIFFKVVNAGFSGIVESLEWLGRTPEQIAQLRTGDSDYMPDKLDGGNTLFVISWMIVLMLGAGASAIAFDLFREGRIFDKSRQIALNIARCGLGPLSTPLLNEADRSILVAPPEKKERVFWWMSFLIGVIYAMCSVAYAFVSTELALTVYSVWWFGGGYKNAIKWGSLAAAAMNFPSVMLSPGEDLQKMMKDLFLDPLALKIKAALFEPLKLICCGYNAPVISSLKFMIFPFFLLLLLLSGLCDTLNNTGGVKGSLVEITERNFDRSGSVWTFFEWMLAALSALTYFANNGWLALKVGLYMCGMIRGALFTNIDGVTDVASDQAESADSDLMFRLQELGDRCEYQDLSEGEEGDRSLPGCCPC